VGPYEELTDKLIASRQDNAKLEQVNAKWVLMNSHQLIDRRQDNATLEQDNASWVHISTWLIRWLPADRTTPSWSRTMLVESSKKITDQLIASSQENAKLGKTMLVESSKKITDQLIASSQENAKLEQDNASWVL
jgi:hypothetical protein